jgi:hypothetical protein
MCHLMFLLGALNITWVSFTCNRVPLSVFGFTYCIYPSLVGVFPGVIISPQFRKVALCSFNSLARSAMFGVYPGVNRPIMCFSGTALDIPDEKARKVVNFCI